MWNFDVFDLIRLLAAIFVVILLWKAITVQLGLLIAVGFVLLIWTVIESIPYWN